MPSTLVLDNEDAVYAYIRSFLNAAPARQLSQSITHMVLHHGVSFTVSYLKDMKLRFRDSFKDNNIHNLKVPKGSFKPVWKLSLENGLKLLNIYTSVRLKEISNDQAVKFISATQVPETNVHVDFVHPTILESGNYRFQKLEWKHPYNWIRSPGKRAPHLCEPEKVITVDENTLSFDSCMSDIFMLDDETKKLVSKYCRIYAKACWVPTYTIRGFLAGPKRDFLEAYKDDVSWNTRTKSPLVGRLGFIQEKGAKLRVVANAFRFHQMVLTPLGDWLLDILRVLPWDCTFDQTKGYDFVRESLTNSKTVYAFDLSNATDTFPLSLQKSLLKKMLAYIDTKSSPPNNQKGETAMLNTADATILPSEMNDIIEIFCDLARGEWSCLPLSKFNNNLTTINWLQGQPLGLYPSFALFALTHGNLLCDIEQGLGLSNTFRVLGDDVVINNSEVAQLYHKRMLALGCSISPSKSIISNKISEFAGKIITADKVLNTPKWCNYSDTDPLGPVRSLGESGFNFVKPSLRKKIKLFAAIPEPVGLGLNSMGLSLDERMTLEILPWFYTRKYNMLTDIDLSHEDRKTRMASVFNRHGPALKNAKQWRVIDVPADRPGTNVDILKIDHYNSVIMGLEPWEDLPPKVSIPQIDDSTPTRSKPSDIKIDRNIINRVYKYYRTLRNKSNQ